MMMPAGKTRATFVEAGLFWRPALRLLGASAITMPWRRIYIIGERLDDPVLRRHEMIHIEQLERDGTVWFCLRYLWWSLRYGYWHNPYEVEAYARENEPGVIPGAIDKRTGRST
jgi:hypothetical protein